MTAPKLFAFITLFLFSAIGLAALFKSPSSLPMNAHPESVLEEIDIDVAIQSIQPAAPSPLALSGSKASQEGLPQGNRIEELFRTKEPKLPIVETLMYKSHVPWLKGRPAWLSDYASHYETSRHFIARSLNGKPDYVKQEIAEGDRFNVLCKEKNIEFYLIVDASRCKMWFYYTAEGEIQPVLLKTYDVGLGRLDSANVSGLLTPLGKYLLGDRIAIYKPKTTGIYHGKKIEMITVFGTRWIPFEKEIGSVTAPAKGFGLHGTPWQRNAAGDLVDSGEGIGNYESDGCIRLRTSDMEEIFSIIITKPTTIEIVPHFYHSSLIN
ncbi:MAG: L,D-transpeptidase [Parachlamydia sp.]|jgi:hypothetical protein|nr:L,D-transpeptidase [Parachlamydia sp.]